MSSALWQARLAKELQISSEVQQFLILYLEEKWLHFGLLKKERRGHSIISLKQRRNCSEHGKGPVHIIWTTPGLTCHHITVNFNIITEGCHYRRRSVLINVSILTLLRNKRTVTDLGISVLPLLQG